MEIALVRCFICVEITNPDHIQQIDAILGQLRVIKGIRPVKLNQLHITLKFLGEVPEQRITTIKQAIASITFPLFSLTFSGLGCFPNERRPRVIWIGLDQGHRELTTLAKEVDLKLSILGFPREKRRFSPHLTLGRVMRLTADDKVAVADLLHSFKVDTGTTEKITTLIFKKSTLTPKGAIYENLTEFPLLINPNND